MFRCGALWRRLRRRAHDPAYADTAIIPILQPGSLDRPARLLHPRQARRATARAAGVQRLRRGAALLGLLGLAAAVGGAWWSREPAGEVAVAGAAPTASRAGAAGGRPAVSNPTQAAASPASAAAPVGAPIGAPAASAVEGVAGAAAEGTDVPTAASAARAAAGALPASRPPARAPRDSAQRARLAALQHEWQVAEAMRLRYRALYAQGLVDWETWQARENEALRLRLQLQALGHPPGPPPAPPGPGRRHSG